MYCLSKFCNICMGFSSNSLINTRSKNILQFRKELEFCVPEVNASSIEFMCQKCYKNLQSLYKFKSMMLKNEKILNEYKLKLKGHDTGEVVAAELQVSAGHSTSHNSKSSRPPAGIQHVRTPRNRQELPKNKQIIVELGFNTDDISSTGPLVSSMLTLRGRTGSDANKPKSMFGCNVYLPKLTVKANLNRHKVVARSDEKTYSCSLCSKMFAHRSTLGAHLLTHAARNSSRGKKQLPNLCCICNKTFKFQSSLIRHSKIHTR